MFRVIGVLRLTVLTNTRPTDLTRLVWRCGAVGVVVKMINAGVGEKLIVSAVVFVTSHVGGVGANSHADYAEGERFVESEPVKKAC